MDITTLTHPDKDSFLKMYKHVPSCTEQELHTWYKTCLVYSEYMLLTSLIARALSTLAFNNDGPQEALVWTDRSLRCLDDKNKLKKSYGGDTDYVAAIQASVHQKVRWQSMLDEPSQWHKAKETAEQMLAVAYPSIYTPNTHEKLGVQFALLLIVVYNRLEQHEHALDLASRLQTAAQTKDDIATECRAGLYWAMSTLLHGKKLALNAKKEDSEAAMLAAFKVLEALADNADASKLVGPTLTWLRLYAKILCGKGMSSELIAFLTNTDISNAYSCLDVLELHTLEQDNVLLAQIVNLIQEDEKV